MVYGRYNELVRGDCNGYSWFINQQTSLWGYNELVHGIPSWFINQISNKHHWGRGQSYRNIMGSMKSSVLNHCPMKRIMEISI